MRFNNIAYCKKKAFIKIFEAMLFVILILFSGCKEQSAPDHKLAAHDDLYYTCSMHPQVMKTKPGKCPICNMDLIPVKKNAALAPGEIQLSDQQILLGNIHVDTIGKSNIGSESILPATLTYNQQKISAISSRVMGRVEKLYHKNIGEYIKKGTPLLEIYSEELNSAKQEYLLALERKKVLDNSLINFDQVINSAKSKLVLLGMTEGQIKNIPDNSKSNLTTTLYSNESGYLTELNVQEGQYISEGGTLMQLADLSTLWAEAQVYTSQYSQLDLNGIVTVRVPGAGKEINGKFEFANPEISPDKRINLIRISIPNSMMEFKPGMSASVVFKGSQHKTISLPSDAIIRDENGASVWVQTGKNNYKNKMVTLGMESNDKVEITSGINEGDRVVIQGAYLLNSEYIFIKGASPMAGMKM